MSSGLEDRFQTLHEVVRAARATLAPGPWDYLIGGTETETTLRRNRLAIDSLAFRPRVLRNVSKVDCTTTFLGKPMRIPVMMAPIGSIESFTPGGGATAAQASAEFGVPQMLSSVCNPGLGCISARVSGEIDSMATMRGRLGYLFQPGLLAYATAGFGFVSGSASASVSGFGLSERFSFGDTDSDFVYGIGVEGKLAPASTLRVEYLGFSDSEIDVIRVGLNFKFGP